MGWEYHYSNCLYYSAVRKRKPRRGFVVIPIIAGVLTCIVILIFFIIIGVLTVWHRSVLIILTIKHCINIQFCVINLCVINIVIRCLISCKS